MAVFRTVTFLTILQTHVIMCSNTTVVTGKEGQGQDFLCKYPTEIQNNSKFFCRVENVCRSQLIRIQKHNRWVTNGRLSLFDNISAGVFVVRMDKLDPEDSGTYWCGVDVLDKPDPISVIQLNVTQTATKRTVEVNIILPSFPSAPANITVDKLNLPIFLTAVSCLAALLFVFLFTLGLVITVRKRRQAPRLSRPMSSDYETMSPGVLLELNPYSCPDSNTFNPPPPEHLCDNFRSIQATGLENCTNVDMSVRISQYENLDLSTVEEHIYYGIHTLPQTFMKD